MSVGKHEIDRADDVETLIELNRLVGWMIGTLQNDGVISIEEWNAGVAAAVSRKRRAATAALEGQVTIDTALGE